MSVPQRGEAAHCLTLCNFSRLKAPCTSSSFWIFLSPLLSRPMCSLPCFFIVYLTFVLCFKSLSVLLSFICVRFNVCSTFVLCSKSLSVLLSFLCVPFLYPFFRIFFLCPCISFFLCIFFHIPVLPFPLHFLSHSRSFFSSTLSFTFLFFVFLCTSFLSSFLSLLYYLVPLHFFWHPTFI